MSRVYVDVWWVWVCVRLYVGDVCTALSVESVRGDPVGGGAWGVGRGRGARGSAGGLRLANRVTVRSWSYGYKEPRRPTRGLKKSNGTENMQKRTVGIPIYISSRSVLGSRSLVTKVG